jgi:hypothetical protein
MNEPESAFFDVIDLRDRERGPAVESAMIRRTTAIARNIQCPDVERIQAAKESGLVKILCWTGSTHKPEASPKIGNPSTYKIGDT